MKTPSLKDRLLYAFDKSLSRGAVGLISWLGAFSAMLIIFISLLVWVLAVAPPDIKSEGFAEILWKSLVNTLDPGTMGGDPRPWPFRFLMLAVTLGGILVVSTLIGVINNILEEKLTQLRKGRSRVLENNHTVILGWTQEIFTILKELIMTNKNKKNPCVVVLASKDKVEMEDEIREKVGNPHNTRIVCRTGNPLEFHDLEIANLKTARSIIVLSPGEENPDSEVIKTLLAIINNPRRRKKPYHIVAVFKKTENLEVAKLVGKNEVVLLLEDGLISRIVAQSCRQSGLSIIYQEILDYAGDEIYFREEPALKGKTYGEALFLFEDSSLIGLMKKGQSSKLNVPMDTIIEEGDQIIIISEDETTIKLSANREYNINEDIIIIGDKKQAQPEKTLILGWNSRTSPIIVQLENYVAPGSIVTVVTDEKDAERIFKEETGDIKHQQVNFIRGDVTSRTLLERLNIQNFHRTILLSPQNLTPQQADSRILITLLHLRDIAGSGGFRFPIVSEMIDPNNCHLASVARADDFIVGSQLVSFILTQISENRLLEEVFAELSDASGSEIYLRAAEEYVKPGVETNFFTIVESAKRRNETAIGYRNMNKSNDPDSAFGVLINPDKSKRFTLNIGDKVIVLAED